MKKTIAALAACAALMPAVAPAAVTALEAARSANICSGLLGAEYLPSGQLKVACEPGTVNPAYQSSVVPSSSVPGVLGGTGLTAGGAAGVAAAVLVVGILAGGDDDAAATTTTGN